jgi:formylglycine-generating enzyme required for sulfatase activity/predicted phosphodiesterase
MTQVESALFTLLSSFGEAPSLRSRLAQAAWYMELAPRAKTQILKDWPGALVRQVTQGGNVAELLTLALASLPDKTAEINAVAQQLGVRFPIRLLHLSDLHFSAKAAWDQMSVLAELVQEVKILRAELGPIHRVVITGDIANCGTAKEYAKAAEWLNGPLAEAAGVKADQIRMVPGNHDVDRKKINLLVSGLDAKLLSMTDGDIAKEMSDRTQRQMLLKRQAAYRKFAEGFNPHDDAPGWRSEEEIEGWAVHFIGLNTAWLSGSHKGANGEVDDHRHLVLSGWQWNPLFLADRPTADLTIALMHHPWEDLTAQDSLAHKDATYRRCGVILRGHLHRVDTLSAKQGKHLVLEAAAGASYADPREGWPHGFQLLELDPGEGRARIHLRKWHIDRRWIPDRERYPDTGANGIVELELRRSTRAPRQSPSPSPAPSEDTADDPPPVRTPREHYGALLKAQLNQLPDVFRVRDGPSTIAGVYVEVTLATSGRELDCAPDALNAQAREASLRHTANVEDLRGRVPLSDVLAHAHNRWGLLGDPGSGKTTLLRHVAVELLSKPSGPLPIYLKVAELERGLTHAITSLCASFNAPKLTDYLLTEAQSGRVVLLIDGLDEAVDLPAARRWVISAAADVGESQVVVASRPIGYKEPSAAFKTLTICPLTAKQQRELLTRWVTDRAKVTASLERLSRTPRLRRLAENPLLLTLVGLLLRAGQDVPSRRGELYERALKLLLTRDHNNEDTPGVPMREPDLTLELLGWAALRLHGLEGEAYRRDALITELAVDARNAARLGKHWTSPAVFVAEVAERTGLLIPDTGRVKDATAYSFPHRTFREFLAATALERDMGPVGAAVVNDASELARVFTEGKERPERWAEVLALTCGRLGPGGADALVGRITSEGNTPLLLRVVADAEGISSETVRATLKLKLGWQRKQLEARQKVIEEIPASVKDLAVAVGLLEQVAKSTTCGHDLFWVREVLRRIERGEVAGGVLDGSVEDAKRAAKGVADNVLSHLDPAKRAELLAVLKPWWREIPAGSFDMGSDQHDDEKPIYRVTFTSGFQMLGVPVTWAMYRLFDPGHEAAREDFGGHLPPEAQDKVPVYRVSWFASVMFAEWVGARLPLEPEWEYACRAGTKTRFWSGDTDEDLARVGWHGDFSGGNAQGHPHPVAEKPKNAWGLHDVHGNVWEWCADERGDYTARADGLTVDPRHLSFTIGKTLPMSAESADRGASRALRGGCWRGRPVSARSAVRDGDEPSVTSRVVGFRLLLCPPNPP